MALCCWHAANCSASRLQCHWRAVLARCTVLAPTQGQLSGFLLAAAVSLSLSDSGRRGLSARIQRTVQGDLSYEGKESIQGQGEGNLSL